MLGVWCLVRSVGGAHLQVQLVRRRTRTLQRRGLLRLTLGVCCLEFGMYGLVCSLKCVAIFVVCVVFSDECVRCLGFSIYGWCVVCGVYWLAFCVRF